MGGIGNSSQFIVRNQNYLDVKSIQDLKTKNQQTNIVHKHKYRNQEISNLVIADDNLYLTANKVYNNITVELYLCLCYCKSSVGDEDLYWHCSFDLNSIEQIFLVKYILYWLR